MIKASFYKSINLTLLALILLVSCKNAVEGTFKKKDTVLVYFTDSLPKKGSYSDIYNNFTETRNVSFQVIRNWNDKTYSVGWYLWIDGEIAESNPEVFTRIKPEELEKFKAKVMRMENERVPHLAIVWDSQSGTLKY